LYPSVEVAAVARWKAQAALATKLGATVVDPEPRDQLVERLAGWSGGVVRRPWEGLPITHPGAVDVVYDTVGSASTVEVGMRVLASRGSLVQLGVGQVERCEWTPWYFKELRLVGSNAFGLETVEGRTQHAMAHYLDLVRSGRVDLDGLLTHTFPLEDGRTPSRRCPTRAPRAPSRSPSTPAEPRQHSFSATAARRAPGCGRRTRPG
jgi:threonine dehydrogenase-like Zn-dependent dehydrogenase